MAPFLSPVFSLSNGPLVHSKSLPLIPPLPHVLCSLVFPNRLLLSLACADDRSPPHGSDHHHPYHDLSCHLASVPRFRPSSMLPGLPRAPPRMFMTTCETYRVLMNWGMDVFSMLFSRRMCGLSDLVCVPSRLPRSWAAMRSATGSITDVTRGIVSRDHLVYTHKVYTPT